MLFYFDTSFANALNISHKIKSPFPPKPKLTNHTPPKLTPKIYLKIQTFLCTLDCTVIFTSKHACFFSCRKVISQNPTHIKKSIFSYFKAENALYVLNINRYVCLIVLLYNFYIAYRF